MASLTAMAHHDPKALSTIRRQREHDRTRELTPNETVSHLFQTLAAVAPKPE